MLLRALLLALSVTTAGCIAQIPLSPPASQRADPRPRLWYVGLGLYDETWSEGDVVAAASALSAERSDQYQIAPILLSYGPLHRYPTPDRATIDAVTTDIARRARPGDVVIIYVSTHGAPGLLAREAYGQLLEPATTAEVAEWLAPLGAQPTLLVLSACFSGSFIPALAADNRIIFAAARPDRTSFGCRAGAEHTVFGQALLDALATPAITLQTLVRRVDGDVADRERDLKVSHPSEPQLSVGPAVTTLYEAPIF